MDNEIVNLGPRVRYWRQHRGLSLVALGELSGLGEAHLSRIEAGKRNPRIETLGKILAALRVPYANFFRRTTKGQIGRLENRSLNALQFLLKRCTRTAERRDLLNLLLHLGRSPIRKIKALRVVLE